MPTKKELYYNAAQHMFVVECKTIPEIARDLKHVSEQTVRNWSAEGDWAKKRKASLAEREGFDLEIYKTAQQLSKSIREDLKEGKEVAPSRFHILAKMLDTIPKAKKAEEAVNTKKDKEFSSLKNLLEAVHKSLTGGA